MSLLCRSSLLLLAVLASAAAGAEPLRHYQTNPHAIALNVPRIGINLGDSTAWGAAQFSRNILKNPGFEGIIDRAIVSVKTADSNGFTDDTAWTQRPDGFWAGAAFSVRTGDFAGYEGVLFDSLATGKQGLPTFMGKGKIPVLSPGDVVSLTQTNDIDFPSQWWLDKDLAPARWAVAHEQRPQGTGQRTLVLKPQQGKAVEVFSYLDAIGTRAGKLLPINGQWRLGLWLRQNQAGANLTVRFRRLNGDGAFFQETFTPTAHWQYYQRVFTATDLGKPETLEFSLRAQGQGEVVIDDVELAAVSPNANTAFRPELVAALKRLQPGYLRDWQGQLGDTYANRNADAFARRASRYRPGADSTFSYSWAEFLQLAKAVNAQPWLIVPPTLGDSELQALGQYLRGQIEQLHFQEILLEFGNENWNQVFRPAGISDAQAHGRAASRAFAQILQGANHHPALRTVVNGQYVNPTLSAQILAHTDNATTLAIAPYFLMQLDADEPVLDALFKQDDFFHETLANTAALGKDLAVYEVNLHTTLGTAPEAAREIATTSAAAGAALAKRLLTALNLGIKRQCVYTLAQYDAFTDTNSLVKLWGIMRDLGDTQRMRPTGLAMAMLNKALPADIYRLYSPSNNADAALTLSALHNAQGWHYAAVSALATPQTIRIALRPDAVAQKWRLLRLDSPTPAMGNEHSENVRIVEEPLFSKNGEISVTIPAYGFVVVLAGA